MDNQDHAEKQKSPMRETYPLKFPFSSGNGSEIKELVLRRARAKDIVAIEREVKRDTGNTSVTLAFLASVNGMDPADLEEIDAEDLLEISEKVIGFLPEKLLAQLGA